MPDPQSDEVSLDIREARRHYPATETWAYFNTAAVGLGSRGLEAAYLDVVGRWTAEGLDYSRGDEAAESARACVARLIGADVADLALIASVSAAAGLVAAQLGEARPGHNVVIGEREYSSNHFPWRLLARKGYEVRQVPFRDGGVEADDLAASVDAGTQLVAVSAVQTATGHRTDLPAVCAVARSVGALVFVDGSQAVGALPLAEVLDGVDVLSTSDHKFLMNAGRGVGYCYLSAAAQDRFVPVNAGWKAGRVPYQSFFGPDMDLSTTASRFDSPVSWLAAVGDEAALSVFDLYGPDAVYARNRDLTDTLRGGLDGMGWAASGTSEAHRSTIVSVPVSSAASAGLVPALRERGVVCSVRDGHLRLAVHFYNHEDDIDRLLAALGEIQPDPVR